MDFKSLFENGRLDEDSKVTELKGIGPYLGARLEAAGMSHLYDVIAYFNNRSRQWVHNHLSVIMQNARKNRPVRTNGARSRVFRATANAAEGKVPAVRYHVPDVNHNGYNVIVDLLRFARDHENEFPSVVGGVAIASIPSHQNTRTLAATYCGGQTSAAKCNRFNVCEWKQAVDLSCAACVPRNSRGQVGFAGVSNFKGQRNERRKPAPPGARFARGWRKSEIIPFVTLPGMPPLPVAA